ncbi:MAG TPA: SDR family NAD(P)-dependent oxidoreductase [Pseudonocardia sp.]|jgi:NAD(P)-dependent dehydrogenase (short-subunit alcohol dehydrogenase family)|nr:SDR family NAD(P)-dependent oxidoreductase [Pseudonocardia sp.]
MRLQGKSVVITGAGSGLGRECSLLFAAEGANIVCADVSAERVAAVVAQINAGTGGAAVGVTADVRDEEQVAAAVAKAVDEFGRLDVMYANAGIMVPGFGRVPLEELSVEAWETTLGVNLTGVFLCAKYATRAMKRCGGGAILVTSSMAALRAYPNSHAYAASKGGVNALVMNLSVDLGKYGIRVNALCPSGGMSPNFLKPGDAPVDGRAYDELREWNPDRAPYPLKLDTPPALSDNAAAALFLVSDEAKWTTGVCLPTSDGGLMHTVGSQLKSGWQDKMAGKPAAQTAQNGAAQMETRA